VGGRPKSVKQKMESVGIGTLLRVLSLSLSHTHTLTHTHTHTHSHVLTSRAAKNQNMAPKNLTKLAVGVFRAFGNLGLFLVWF
jgi:hypothetical protein